MTQVEAAVLVLQSSEHHALKIPELWAEINRRNLCTSFAKNPIPILREQVLRRCEGTRRMPSDGVILFRKVKLGLFELTFPLPERYRNLPYPPSSFAPSSPLLPADWPVENTDHQFRSPQPLRGEDAEDAYQPRGLDSREIARREIKARRGQIEFRTALIMRYGGQCVISGCSVLDVLEAAHIKPYRGEPDNHLDNGLLLRSDLHTLFDADLLGIEPETLTVLVHPSLMQSEYAIYNDESLRCGDKRPSGAALKIRFEDFKRRNTR